MPSSRQFNIVKVDIRSKMGEIIRGKRRQCVYEKADEEVFIKRQRLNSEGDSNDSLDSDTRFTYTAVQTQQSQQTVKDAATAKTSEVSFKYDSFKASQASSEVVKEQLPPVKAKTSPRLRLKKVEPCAESAAGTDSREVAICDVEADRQDTEDNREVNRRSPNGFLLPDPLPKGELLRDTLGQAWVLGPAIGLGGFGELYLAARQQQDGSSSPQHFVIKVEPHSNGPLFVEIHFYLRATRADQLETFRTSRGIHHLGVPRYIASGSHCRSGQKYRFLVMERFGSDLQRILDHSEGGRFNEKTVCEVALQVLDSLEFIHSQGYVHKDVKASNLLVGLGQQGQHLVHLVDFGLCSKYMAGGIHKQYTHDLRWAHEGTLEYTSRDAHIGSASRRGDIEVLVYNLIEWWGGQLPWDRDLASPELTKVAKFRAWASPARFLRSCFGGATCPPPPLLLKLMKYVGGLQFEEAPDYQLMRSLIKQEMSRLGCRQDGRLQFRLGPNGPALPTTTTEDSLAAEFLRPLPADGARVSAVFDRMCVSERSWQAARDRLISERDVDSLSNPTQAMLDVMEMIRMKPLLGNRKRNKSGAQYYGDGPSHTPAMLEVLKLLQLRKCRENEQLSDPAAKLRKGSSEEPDPASASLLPARVLPSRSPIPMELLLNSSRPSSPKQLFPPLPAADKLRSRRQLAGGSKELARLNTFMSEPEPRRRTRSADVTDTELSRHLRSAFRLGLGNMTRMLRQVSDSFTKMF